jgi:hypothetical protein
MYVESKVHEHRQQRISLKQAGKMSNPEKLRTFGFQGATAVDRQVAQGMRQKRISHYAKRIVHEKNMNPAFTKRLQAEQAKDKNFQNDLNKELNLRQNAEMARLNSSPLAIAGKSIEQLANPIEWGAAGVRGVGELAHGHVTSGALDVAGILPVGKVAKLGRIAKTAKGAEDAARAAEDALKSCRRGEGCSQVRRHEAC